MNNTFQYRSSQRIIQWGGNFDSRLELKYAPFLSPGYEWLRSPVSIYFDPSTKRPVHFIRKNSRRYTPDFLIRHKVCKEAFWVEVKPHDYSDQWKLEQNKQLAEKYIRWRGYDWKFKVVYDDEFALNMEQTALFNEYSRMLDEVGKKIEFGSCPLFAPPSHARTLFVMFGKE